MRKITSRFILALLAIICAGATTLKAQNFVYTNDNPGVPGQNSINTVTGYAVNAAGNLTQIPGSPFSTGGRTSTPQSIFSVRTLTAKAGNHLFAANDGDGSVSSFSINPSTGVLTLVSGSPFPTPFSACNGSYGLTLTATPDGSFLFVGSICSTSIASFSIAANGTLTPVSGSPFTDGCNNQINAASGDGVNAARVSPDGRYLADVDGTCGIAKLNITSSGALVPVPSSPFPPLGSNNLEIPCSSDYVFSLQLNPDINNNNVSSSVYTVQLGASGTISELPLPSPGPGLLVLSNDDRFLFVSSSNPSGVIVYAVGAGGALTLVPGSPFLYSGGEQGAMEMGISGDGKFLYVSSSVAVTGNVIAVFAINSSNGSLTEVAGSPLVNNLSSLSALAAYPPKNCAATPPPPVGNSVFVVVPGRSNPYLAGMPNGSGCCGGDIAPDQSPVQATPLGFSPGDIISFNVTGSVSFGGGTPTDPPDGSSFLHTPSNNGMSGINGPVDALLGVFLNDNQADITITPLELDFSSAGLGKSFTSLSPALQEVFFVGDGLTGNGVGSVQRFIVPFGATRLFLGTDDGSSWNNNSGQFDVTVNSSGPPPPLTMAPQPLVFPVAQPVGIQSGTQTATVTNITTSPVTFGSFNPSAGFSIVSNSCSPNTPLAAGGHCTIGVTFTPAVTGTVKGSIVFTAFTPSLTSYTLNLTGTGIPAVPAVTLTPTSWTFTQTVGVPSSKTVILKNTGSATLTINNTQFTGPFDFGTTCLNVPPLSLSPGDTCSFNVTFTPISTVSVSGSIVITDNAADSPQTVTLTGNGIAVGVPVASFSSTNLTFAPTVVGTSSVGRLVTLTNTGTGPLVLGAGSVTLDDTTNYSIADGCVAASPIASGAGCAIVVEIHPGAVGTTPVGTVSVADNASGSPQHILLHGSGTATCVPGNDTDGDGLCDDWETNGLIARINGNDVFVDLPSMGADPNHKDIFIQVDYMQTASTAIGAHHHDMTPGAEKVDIAAFAAGAPVSNPDGNPGIHLHVDCGPTCIMDPVTGATWGSSMSRVQKLTEPPPVGTPPQVPLFGSSDKAGNYDWTTFDQNSIAFKNSGRAFAFHHAIFVHNWNTAGNAGVSRNGSNVILGASDLILSFGKFSSVVGTDDEQSAILMHELGHNLGLRHGGSDETNYKPNYLSVMNYAFTFPGLIESKSMNGQLQSNGGYLDYSRFKVPNLDGTRLVESAGLTGGDNITGYGTYYYCPGNFHYPGPTKPKGTYPAVLGDPIAYTLNAYGYIDWNCNGIVNIALDYDIDGDFDTDANGKFTNGITDSNLTNQKDWPVLVYTGGAVGGLGAGVQIPSVTPANEITQAEASGQVYLNRVQIAHPGIVALLPGSIVNLTLIVSNTGINADTYNLTGSSVLGWGTFPGLPPAVTLAGGASRQIQVTINVPVSAQLGTTDKITVAAVSQASPVRDSAEISIEANSAPNPVTVSVASLTLDTLNVGSTGPARPILVTNTSGATLSIASIAASGDFNQTNTCGNSLSAGASCVISVGFVPTAAGIRNGAITINDSATGSPQTVSLSGTASASPTTTALGSSLNPSVVGQSVTFTATVTGTGGTPTGTVTFFDGTTSLGTGALNGSGVATFTMSSLAVGSHSITAQYGGDSIFSGSIPSPALVQVVNVKPSATALVSSLNPEVGGQSVTFTATVASTAGGTPTGNVTFFDGATSLGTGALNGSGVATFATTSLLVVGSRSITASYSGDVNYATSTSPGLTEVVNVAGFAPVSGSPTVTAGQSVIINLTLFAASGSNLNFALSCSGTPSKSSCSFSPNPAAGSPPPNGTAIQMTFSTSNSNLPASPRNRSPWPWGLPGIFAVLAALFAAGMIRLRYVPRRRLAFGVGLAVVVLAMVLAGCGSYGGSSSAYTGTPKGPATFTVTGTSGATTISTTVSVTVQ